MSNDQSSYVQLDESNVELIEKMIRQGLKSAVIANITGVHPVTIGKFRNAGMDLDEYRRRISNSFSTPNNQEKSDDSVEEILKDIKEVLEKIVLLLESINESVKQ